jgi:hypothetical protein
LRHCEVLDPKASDFASGAREETMFVIRFARNSDHANDFKAAYEKSRAFTQGYQAAVPKAVETYQGDMKVT